MTRSFLNRTDLPRGLRNNNPGNLIRTSIAWQGKVPHHLSTDSKFEQFYDLRDGIRAMMRDLVTDHGKGLRTATALISEFAPAFENNTAAYIGIVSRMIGVGPVEPILTLTREKLIGLAKAIVYVENGAAYSPLVIEQDYVDAYANLGKTLPSEKKNF